MFLDNLEDDKRNKLINISKQCNVDITKYSDEEINNVLDYINAKLDDNLKKELEINKLLNKKIRIEEKYIASNNQY